MRHVYLFTALIALLLLASLALPQPCARGCNVILIMVDTLSAKHLATYGYERDTMPRTEAFFEKGVVFEQASSNAPWTLPSFTSMYFSDVASRVTYADLEPGARANFVTSLREHGVTIRALVPGLDNFIFDGITKVYEPGEMIGTNYGSPFGIGGQEVAQLSASDEPFFLLLHTFQAHDPYHPKEPFNTTYGASDEYETVTMEHLLDEYVDTTPNQERVDIFRLRYDQQLLQTDADIATFLEQLPPEVLEDTVVILASDHGEAFNEHGLLFHANSLFEEELHIPLMMRVPGMPASRVSEPVSLLDIGPTILALQNVAPPSGFIGENLLPVIRGENLADRPIPYVNGRPFFLAWVPGDSPFFSSVEEAGAKGTDHPIVAPAAVGVRIGSQKAFIQQTPEQHAGLHVYNLATDPGETETIDTLSPDLEEALRSFFPDLQI